MQWAETTDNRSSDIALLSRIFSVIEDPAPYAKAEALMARWKSIPHLLAAPIGQIALEVGHRASELLAAIHPLTISLLRSEIEDRPLLGTGNALRAYLFARLGRRAHEELWCLYLDAGQRLIAERKVGDGSGGKLVFSSSPLLRTAIEVGANALILVHNHPSGELSPSQSDMSATRALVDVAAALEISVADHVIVSRLGCLSMRAEGYL